MDCLEIRDRFRAGGMKAEADALAHARECTACGSLLADGGALARELSEAGGSVAVPAPGAADFEPLFQSVIARTHAETGARAWARSRPTWQRRALILAAAAPLAGFDFATAGLRSDFESYPGRRMALALVVFLGVAVSTLRTATRPLHQPEATPASVYLKTAVALAVGFVVALLPVAHEVAPGTASPATLHCYMTGLLLGAPVLAAALWVRRQATLRETLLFAVTSGLVANFVIQLICSATDHAHLVLGHASVGVTFAALVLVARALGPALAKTESPFAKSGRSFGS